MRNLLMIVGLLVTWGVASTAHIDPVQGNRTLSDERILQHLSVKGFDYESPAQPPQWERAVRIVRNLYQDQGYPLARVTLDRSDSKPFFRVAEGPFALLGQIEVKGNQFFSKEDFSSFFEFDSALDFNELELGLDGIRQLYRNAGFVRAAVRQTGLRVLEIEKLSFFPVPRKRAQNRVRLEITVEEGPLFRLGRVDLPPELDPSSLTFPKTGQIYSEKELDGFRLEVRRRYAEKGHLIKEFQILQRLDEPARRVDLDVRFQLFPPLAIRRIEFRGHKNYPETFYRRELALQETELLDPRLVDASLRSLTSTGVVKPLSDDSVELRIDEEHREVEVLFRVEEKKRHGILHSLSRGDLGEIQMELLYRAANLLGLGEKLGLQVSHGGGTTGAAVNVASRYLFGTNLPVSIALRFFRRRTGLKLSDLDEKARRLFFSKKTGLSGSAAYRIQAGEEIGLRFEMERVSAQEKSSHLALEPFWSRKRSNENRTSDLQMGTRVSLFHASHASSLRPWLQYNTVGQASQTAPRFRLRFQAAHARFTDRKQLLSERLFNDSDTLRGFSQTTTGPWGRSPSAITPLGGDTQLALNSELNVDLNRAFSLVPFVDTGLNFSSKTPPGLGLIDGTNRVLRASMGGELRIQLPASLPTLRIIGAWNPLRLDREILTGQGLARLKDPKAVLRLAFDPVF